MEIVKVGSLYCDGEVIQPGSACPGRVSIGLGNTVPGMELQWVKDGDRLIADRCVCVDISWNKLDQQGYIFGRTVMIDGNPYRCRSLKMESSEPSSNEWFDLLDKYGDAIELWNWNIRSFGQETRTGTMENKKYAIARGVLSRSATFVDISKHSICNGFRPVLEPLTNVSKGVDKLIGCRVKVFGPKGDVIIGKLESFDEYDMVLSFPGAAPSRKGWITRRNKTAIISRSAVSWVEEAT